MIAPEPSDLVAPQVSWTLATVALLCAAIGFGIKNKFTPGLEQQLRQRVTISKTDKQRWVLGYFVAFGCSLAVVLFGFVLLFLGAGKFQVIPFDVAGIVLLLLFAPRVPQ